MESSISFLRECLGSEVCVHFIIGFATKYNLSGLGPAGPSSGAAAMAAPPATPPNVVNAPPANANSELSTVEGIPVRGLKRTYAHLGM